MGATITFKHDYHKKERDFEQRFPVLNEKGENMYDFT